MKKLRENAAAFDLGSKSIFLATENEQVRSFGTFTEDFYQARDHLKSLGIETVAMEATGVYWLALFDILSSAGFDVWLVDGRQTKQLPGRKTDVKDCQWILQLHVHGLLSRCFIPEKKMQEIRSYQRLREDHIRSASMHINHMQKALIEMNIRLPEVLSQIHGKTGQALIKAILDGERNPTTLLSLCHSSVQKSKADQILKALNGHYTQSGLFSLKQAFTAYHFYQDQMAECDAQLDQALKRINNYEQDEQVKKKNDQPLKRKEIRHNRPKIEKLGGHLIHIFKGIDATQLPGITDYTWLQIFATTGPDLLKWPTENHFTSWLGLAPGQHQSGKMKKSRSKKSHPAAGQIFRTIAQGLLESKKIALGAFGRKLRSKKGAAIAIKAVARKLAILYWRLMIHGSQYVEHGIKAYEEKLLIQKERWIRKTASELGMQLTHY